MLQPISTNWFSDLVDQCYRLAARGPCHGWQWRSFSIGSLVAKFIAKKLDNPGILILGMCISSAWYACHNMLFCTLKFWEVCTCLNSMLSCHLASCHTHTCHNIVITNIIIRCTTHLQNANLQHSCPLTRVLWSSQDPHHTHVIQLMATANTSVIYMACQM